MKISEVKFHWYDESQITGPSIIQAFMSKDFDGTNQLSGLPDLLEYCAVIEEYMSIYPEITFRELGKNRDMNVGGVWEEPENLALKFSRSLKINARVQQEKVSRKRGAEGNSKEAKMEVWIGLPDMIKHDYYPRPGDEFVFRGTPYQLSLTTTDPEDYFQLTGVPLYVRGEAMVKQQSVLPLIGTAEALTETELPSQFDPSSISSRGDNNESPHTW